LHGDFITGKMTEDIQAGQTWAQSFASFQFQRAKEILEDAAFSMKNTVQAESVSAMKRDAKKYKVTVEAKYEIGEYDILILSAKESNGLERWLLDNGYKIPNKAKEVLEPYVKNDIKFFVVKVNLEKQRNSGFKHLSPIQISFESDRFMLPIRLGMANAKDEQDLVVYAFTREGRVEPTNYRTVKIPSNRNVPLFVERYFGEFYKDLFHRAYYREKMNSVFLEYAWNVSPMNGVKSCMTRPPTGAVAMCITISFSRLVKTRSTSNWPVCS